MLEPRAATWPKFTVERDDLRGVLHFHGRRSLPEHDEGLTMLKPRAATWPKFMIERDDLRGVLRFHGEFPTAALATLNLDPLDRALLNDARTGATAADDLLMLEMLFRRYAEQHARPDTRSTDSAAPLPDAPPEPRASDDAAQA